jgi:3-keto-5-aminohexanoate cleavage enzyme
MQSHGIKPINKIRSDYDRGRMERELIDRDLIESPGVFLHDMGLPYGWPLDADPWWPLELCTTLERTKQQFPDGIVGVCAGGRNWFPIAVMAILAGAEYVQVGIENAIYEYPHRDTVIERNLTCVEKVVSFCQALGREVATPSHARELLGLELT